MAGFRRERRGGRGPCGTFPIVTLPVYEPIEEVHATAQAAPIKLPGALWKPPAKPPAHGPYFPS